MLRLSQPQLLLNVFVADNLNFMKVYFLNGEYKFSSPSSDIQIEPDTFLEVNWQHGWIQKICGDDIQKTDFDTVLVEDHEKIKAIFEGYIPKLTQGGKLSTISGWSKSDDLLQKEAKQGEKEAKKEAKEALVTKLKADTISDSEIKDLLKLLV